MERISTPVWCRKRQQCSLAVSVPSEKGEPLMQPGLPHTRLRKNRAFEKKRGWQSAFQRCLWRGCRFRLQKSRDDAHGQKQWQSGIGRSGTVRPLSERDFRSRAVYSLRHLASRYSQSLGNSYCTYIQSGSDGVHQSQKDKLRKNRRKKR